MHKHIKRTFILTLGIIFILLGLLGLALPFLQGLFFLIIGFMLLSLYSPKIRYWVKAHTVKYPKLHRIVEKTDAWLIRIIGEV